MWLRRLLPVFVLGILIPWGGPDFGGWVSAQECTGTNGCSCEFSDGSGTVDITSLGNQDKTPRFKDVLADDTNFYSYNPCFSFNEGDCQDASVCQISNNKKLTITAGSPDTFVWSYDGLRVQLYYNSEIGGVLRESYVNFECDPSAEIPMMAAQGERTGQATKYDMTVTTKCACRNACVGGNSSQSGLSPGTIMILIVLALLIIYVAAGVVFNKTRRDAKGADLIPNRQFWGSLPGLVKDGFIFVVNKVRRKDNSYNRI